MKKEIVISLINNFESFANKTNDGVEFWLARDLQHLLDYGKWDNLKNVISKAKTACELSEQNISDHFADVGKMVDKVERKLNSDKKRSLTSNDNFKREN